jgi:tetratricopeptide (TPR) repeat protein
MTSSTLAVDNQLPLTEVGESLEMEYENLMKDLEIMDHASVRDRFHHLAQALFNKYEESDDPAALDRSITLWRHLLSSNTIDSPSRSDTLHDLANALQVRYSSEHSTESDLDQAVACYRDALVGRSPGHKKRADTVTCLEDALDDLYERSGDPETAREASTLLQEMLASPDDFEQGATYTSLARLSWSTREHTASLEALKQTVQHCRNALRFQLDEDEARVNTLLLLANALEVGSREMNDTSWIEEALLRYEEILTLWNTDHENRGWALCEYAIALDTYYKLTDDKSALHKSVRTFRGALTYHPTGHEDRPWNLLAYAAALESMYRAEHDVSHLRTAIVIYRELLDTHTDDSGRKGLVLNNMAICLSLLFHETHSQQDLTESIDAFEESLLLITEGQRDRAINLSNLGLAKLRRFQSTGDEVALQQSVAHLQESIALMPPTHPFVTDNNSYLSMGFLSPKSSLRDPDRGLQYLLQAITHSSSGPKHRLSYAKEPLDYIDAFLSSTAEVGGISEKSRAILVEVYRQLVTLFPRVASWGSYLDRRLEILEDSDHIGLQISRQALHLNRADLALELLEAARGVFWAQALKVRDRGLDALPAELAEELRPLLKFLGQETIRSSHAQVTAWTDPVLSARRKSSERAEEIIDQARKLPGLDRFMLAPTCKELLRAAANSHVVVLIPGPTASEAIILRHRSSDLQRLHLPLINQKSVDDLASRLLRSRARNRGAVPAEAETERLGLAASRPALTNSQLLRELWIRVVKPVIDVLSLQQAEGRARPRLHWCPTGSFAFLPLHATGAYRAEGPAIACANFVVSSYTPTLSALLKAQEASATSTGLHTHSALLIGEHETAGLPRLKHVGTEIDVVGRVLADASVDCCVSSQASAETVAQQLSDTTIAHFACHGTQNASRPLESGFHLREGMLDVADLMRLDLPHAFLAFLSACETAKGDQDQPNQAVHLCAAMLFCGFKSVVGTMW